MKIASDKLRILYERGRFKFLKGGRGSLKSWGWAQAVVILMTNYNMRILCCREIQKSIKASSYRLIIDTINRYGIANDFKITLNEITHKKTGAMVLFEGLKSNPEKIKSMEAIDLAVVEEAENVTKASIEILHPTVFRNAGSEIWYIWNPRYPTDEVQRLLNSRLGEEGVFVEHFTYQDNPFWSNEQELERLSVLKEDPDLHDWIYLGGYLAQSSRRLLSYKDIESSVSRVTVDAVKAKKVLGVDVARYGDDSTAFRVRQGNRFIYSKKVKGFNSVAVQAMITNIILDQVINTVVIDCTGGHGTGIFDNLETKFSDVEFIEYNSSFGADDGSYYNKRAEVYARFAEWVKTSGNLPDDKDLLEELQNIEYFYNKTSSQFQIEPKDVIKTRINRSPDDADACSMTFAVDDEIKPERKHASKGKKIWITTRN